MENFQRIERFTSILDEELSYIPNNPTLTPARYSIYMLKFLFDGLWNVIHILKTIVEEEHPDFLRIYTTYPIKSHQLRYAFSNEESVYVEVLNMPGWNIPIEIIKDTNPDAPDQTILNQKNTTFSRLLAWIKGKDLFFNLGLIGKREGFVLAAAALYYYITCWHRKPVLIYNSGYNWDDTLFELYRAGVCPIFRLSDEDIDRTYSNVQNYHEVVQKVCCSHPAMREFEQIFDIDVSSFFFDRASRIIGDSFGESIHSYLMTREMISQKKIRCLLHSARDRPRGHAIIKAAHDEGIPVVSWQHGGAGYYYHPIMPYIEFIDSDLHFVFGKGVAESYRTTIAKLGLKNTPVFVEVGSSSLDTFHMNSKKLSIKPANKSVVYITTAYLQNLYTIPHPYDPSDYDEHLWQIQMLILDLARKNPEKSFIMKFNSSQKNLEPVISYVNNNGIKNIKIVTSEMSIWELIEIADIVIFDLISTAILQVLTSETQVFAYSGLSDYDPGIVMQLKKRAYVSNNPREFIDYIEEYIKTRNVSEYPVDLTNNSFMVQYGTDIHTHNSAEKAVKKLIEIIH